jgi:hypothetical protein
MASVGFKSGLIQMFITFWRFLGTVLAIWQKRANIPHYSV